MIITLQGTFNSPNHANELLAALSVLGYAQEQKKTLVLQFTNKDEESVENLLIGGSLRNESLISDTSIPDVSLGMDPLVAKTRGYDKDVFSSTTKAMVSTKRPNLFDVAYCSRKESFEEELLSREADIETRNADETGIIENILTAADEAYELVYVLVPSDNRKLAHKILEFADVSLVCVRQGREESYIKTVKGDSKTIIVADDFSFGSKYNSKTMAKIYGVPTIYALIHTVAFKDAVADGTVLSWINRTRGCQKSDPSYDFIHNIELLYNFIVGNKGKKKSEIDEDELPKIERETSFIRTWEPVNYDVVIEVRKTGLFRKKTDERITLEPVFENSDGNETFEEEVTEYTE